jgi:hypothetical protein
MSHGKSSFLFGDLKEKGVVAMLLIDEIIEIILIKKPKRLNFAFMLKFKQSLLVIYGKKL